MKRLDDWRASRGPVVCHASELVDEFGTIVSWKGPFSHRAVALYSLFGVEPSRAEANLLAGRVIGVLRIPPPHSKMKGVARAMELEHNPALIVRRGERVFVEPALRHPNGFAVLPEPLKVAKRMSEEIGYPVLIVKEVPSYCCWHVSPLAWTGVPLSEAGRFRRGVPVGVSVPRTPVLEGCWQLDEEVEWEEGEGFPMISLKYIKIAIIDKIKMLLLPLRELEVMALSKP
ncbi:MAG: hypothetical protein GXO07_06460 [Crenarchaeota archaeon]|nr:hypothetical protein [Thermoproteota archaeon]